ncbi:glycosyltransferase [Metabacillus sp. KIGAM252]|uniref:Glycosyltransferase n=1 Tax=Metabacillus flavus TaxID=2823519 RepID=A0ABS5LG30_9BACI|nr:glycosyltransferase [Metabacillus flavus]MBS2969652.1 glycosyltransferase [Metabacillus flavus]
MEMKVSVIIPVYNAEKYVAHCAESLLNQTLEDCEYIFINDGSNDRSQLIIEQYSRSDKRVVLINQDNHGVSAARNRGLLAAKGIYVAFVDADDYIESNMLEILYEAAVCEEIDVIVSNFESKMDEEKVMNTYPFAINKKLNKEYIGMHLVPYLIQAEDLNTVCTKLYRNHLIKENRIRFPEGVALGEDGLFNMKYFCCAESLKYINYSGYHYREVAGSATRNLSEKDYFSNALKVYLEDLPEEITAKMNKTEIIKLKSIKFIRSVLAYIHLYFASKELSFSRKMKQVRKMIQHDQVQHAADIFLEHMKDSINRYDQQLLKMLKIKSVLGLYGLTSYSRFRNKQAGGM